MLFLFLTSYHVLNHKRLTFPGWKASTITVTHRANLEKPRPLFVTPVGQGFTDFSSHEIGRWGYAFRYLVSYISEAYFYEKRENTQEFFNRGEVAFEYLSNQKRLQTESLGYLREALEKLSHTGATIVILPVPSKLSLVNARHHSPMHQHLYEFKNSGAVASPRQMYRTVIAELKDHSFPINLFDSYAQYLESHVGAYLYPPQEYHWSSLGTVIAADQILTFLGVGNGYQKVGYAPGIKEGIGHLGPFDILPKSFLATRSELQWYEPLYNLKPLKKAHSFGRLLLLGTSFSQRYKERGLGLGDILSQALNCPLLDYSKTAGGISGALSLMVQKKTKVRPDDLILWEFPVAELLMAPERSARTEVLASQIVSP